MAFVISPTKTDKSSVVHNDRDRHGGWSIKRLVRNNFQRLYRCIAATAGSNRGPSTRWQNIYAHEKHAEKKWKTPSRRNGDSVAFQVFLCEQPQIASAKLFRIIIEVLSEADLE